MNRPLTVLVSFFLLAILTSRAPGGASEKAGQILPPGQTQADLKAYLTHLAPKYVCPTDPEKWQREAAQLRRRLLDEVVLRGVPKSWLEGPPNVVWGERINGEGYVIRKLRFEVVPGFWVGALLYEPLIRKGKVPAVLNLNGHVGPRGMTIFYKQARCINLVKRGMLALNLEWIGMGQLRWEEFGHYGHNDLAYLDLCGRSGLSVFYLPLKRGLDILCAHPATDLERVAVTGLSGGGWQTILLSSLDPRVKLAAPNAGYITLPDRIEHVGDVGDLEQNYTDLVSVADYDVLTALLVPRPALLIYNAQDECCFVAERARPAVYEPIVPLYRLFGKPSHFAFHVNKDPGTHNYLKDNREAFYRFLNRHFLPEGERIDEDVPVENEIRTQEELAIEYPPDNGSLHTLAAEAMRSLPRQKRPRGDDAALKRWRRRARRALKTIVRPEAGLKVDPDPSGVSEFRDEVQGIRGRAFRLRLSDTWTLPMVEYGSSTSPSATTTLIVADGGMAGARDRVATVLSRKERAIVAGLLFTGECVPTDREAWRFAQVIGTVGRRPLGIQVAQIDAILDYIRKKYPGERLRVVTRGRVAGLAALVSAALRPSRMAELRLLEMESSLKNLLKKKIGYQKAPSMFCFGLLEVVDVPELIELARPTQVDLVAGD